MDNQITLETKEKIIALYYGCEVFNAIINDGTFKLITVKASTMTLLNKQDHLLLTPLSQITEKDAKECIKIYECIHTPHGAITEYSQSIQKIREAICQIVVHSQPAADYLRSKSYALPAFGYTVEELVEDGIFKLTAARH